MLRAVGIRHSIRLFAMGLVLVGGMSPVAAEELILKSGQKIVGTIVGYENGMFRVETEFGFALIRKDKVASVNFAAGSSGEPAHERKGTSVTTQPGAMPTGRISGSNPVEPAISPGAVSGTAAKAPLPPAPVSRPINEPLPPRLEEHLEGNNYINDTFQFAMFKPPGWKIYEGVPRETGSGIMAMGTEDEQTLLIVDRQAWTGPPDLKNDHMEAKLRRTYQDYQRLSESPLQLDSHPAMRRDFKGVLDGVEWHGVSVQVAQGNAVFGIVGLTSAETFQFQQAVFNKIINSFRFLKGKPGGSGTP